MKIIAKNFLTSEEQKTVTQAVQRAERTTSGEIVPMIVSGSHHYPMATLTGAIFLTVPSAIISTTLLAGPAGLPPANMWVFLLLSLLLFPLFFQLVKRLPTLQSHFLWASQVDEEVQEGAVNAFYSQGLHKTRAENGILIYISVFERKVWILADSGINRQIQPQTWEDIVSSMTQEIKNGQRCSAICTAVEKVGKILEKNFPIQDDDKNELHDLIIQE